MYSIYYQNKLNNAKQRDLACFFERYPSSVPVLSNCCPASTLPSSDLILVQK